VKNETLGLAIVVGNQGMGFGLLLPPSSPHGCPLFRSITSNGLPSSSCTSRSKVYAHYCRVWVFNTFWHLSQYIILLNYTSTIPNSRLRAAHCPSFRPCHKHISCKAGQAVYSASTPLRSYLVIAQSLQNERVESLVTSPRMQAEARRASRSSNTTNGARRTHFVLHVYRA
jgi:hypothetical protein